MPQNSDKKGDGFSKIILCNRQTGPYDLSQDLDGIPTGSFNNAAREFDQLQLALLAEREVVQPITTNYTHCQDCSFPS